MENISKKIASLFALLLLVCSLNAQVVNFIYTNPCTGSATHFTSSSTYPGGIFSYHWNFGDGNTSVGPADNVMHTYADPGPYLVTLQIFDISNTLIDAISKNVLVYSPPVASFTDKPTCLGSETDFTNTSHGNGTEILTYAWNFGDGEGDVIETPIHTYSHSGNFPVTLIVESSTGCRDTSSVMNSEVFPLPDATISSTKNEICQGDSLTLSVDVVVNDHTLILWSNGSTSTSITVKPDTSSWYTVVVYEVHYAEQLICQISQDFFATVHPTPVISIVNDTTKLPGQYYLTVVSNFNIKQYIWSPMTSLTNPYSSQTYANPTYTTTYYVSVTDEYGCHNIDSIKLGNVMKLNVNNLITPNGDGKNDIWTVGDEKMADQFEVYIYNRWGDEVFSKNGVYVQWDGKYKGNLLPEGTYYYLVKQAGKTYTGAITLVK
ncbi:MAG: PKD domain-containing protein [Bacteroidia bacterium]|nr:PKD domain-containing protein [Bacteroidia bacterium]